MQNTLFIALAVIMGAVLSIYLPMNSSVARHLDSTFLANVSFFGVALITAIVIFMIFGNTSALSRLGSVPLYLYITGFISAFFILGTTFLVPHLGARRMFVLIISGQIITAMVVSHFGILESPKDPVTIKKLTGSLVVILGAYISIS